MTFGEVMGRLAPEGFFRLVQAMPGQLEFTFGGAGWFDKAGHQTLVASRELRDKFGVYHALCVAAVGG